MTTTEDLYQQAYETYDKHSRILTTSEYVGLRAVVDLALAARPEPTEQQPWEVLREAADIYGQHGTRGWAWTGPMTGLAKRLEAEHRAAQERAEREAEREKLIEQAARVLHKAVDFGQVREWVDLGDDQEFFLVKARALADAGFLSAPTTNGGEA